MAKENANKTAKKRSQIVYTKAEVRELRAHWKKKNTRKENRQNDEPFGSLTAAEGFRSRYWAWTSALSECPTCR